jgi:hypothetical protein
VNEYSKNSGKQDIFIFKRLMIGLKEQSILRNRAERRHAMRMWMFVMIVLLTCISGCASLESMCEKGQEIPLSDVPVVVVDAARQAVENITFTEAEIEEEYGRRVYVLEGEVNGKEYEIEVTADGEVLEVEQEGMFDDFYDDDD